MTSTRQRDPNISHYGYGGEPVYFAPDRKPAPRHEDLVSFAKLPDGSWGIRGLGLVSGSTVTVTKRNGETSEVVVGEVTKADPYSTDRRTRSAYDLATFTHAPRPEVTRVVTAEVEVQAPAADGVVVPDGRYAVYNDDQSVNDIGFYKVENVTEGNWAGWTFVKQIVGPDERKLSQKQGRRILAKINALGQREASQLFGHNTHKCGVCNTNLTNKESREYGIGPDCRAKYGW